MQTHDMKLEVMVRNTYTFFVFAVQRGNYLELETTCIGRFNVAHNVAGSTGKCKSEQLREA